MKIRLEKFPDPDNHFDRSHLVHEVDIVTLDEMLQAFEAFTRACEFSIDGNLEFVVDDHDMNSISNRLINDDAIVGCGQSDCPACGEEQDDQAD